MTNDLTSSETVERLACANETRSQTRPHAPFITISEPEPLGVETAAALRALRDALDKAKTERDEARASVAELEGALKWRDVTDNDLEHRANEEARHGNREALEKMASMVLAAKELAHWVDERRHAPCERVDFYSEKIAGALVAFRAAENGET